MEEKLIATQGL